MSINEVITTSEEKVAFYYQLGRAITTWAHVEFALAGIVAVCFLRMDPDRRAYVTQLAADGFLSIENLRSKKQYVDLVINQQNISKKEIENWHVLSDRCQSLGKKRNCLAHYWVDCVLQDNPGRRIKLLPKKPDQSPDHPPTEQKYRGAICLRDIAGYALEFLALSRALENFCDRLVPQEERFPKSQEQPLPLPTLAQIRREIYAYASRPPRPSSA